MNSTINTETNFNNFFVQAIDQFYDDKSKKNSWKAFSKKYAEKSNDDGIFFNFDSTFDIDELSGLSDKDFADSLSTDNESASSSCRESSISVSDLLKKTKFTNTLNSNWQDSISQLKMNIKSKIVPNIAAQINHMRAMQMSSIMNMMRNSAINNGHFTN